MDTVQIERIRSTHRPRIFWLGCTVAEGCTCGSRAFPCRTLWDLNQRLQLERDVHMNAGRW